VTTDTLREYEYLWNGSESGWVLVCCDPVDTFIGYLIYNKQKSTALVVEDSEIQRCVCEKLLALGTEVLEELPKTEFDVENLDIEVT